MTTVSLKDSSVHPKGMAPQLALAALIVHSVLDARGVPFVITSMNDGTHAAHSARHPRSLHYEGAAFDLRLPSRYTGDKGTDAAIKLALEGSLGSDFDVVLEGDHFHIEYDPKESA